MTDDPQEVAESLDQDKIDDGIDSTGDDFGDGLVDYPPDRPMGVGTIGVTPVEEDAGESFAERTAREISEVVARDPSDTDDDRIGALVDPDVMDHDDEEQLLAEMEPGSSLSAEESAMHIEPE
jgi:hypothetical protein